jgi:putative ABC transport system permease protein
MQTLWQDLRFGARMLLKQPGFTLIAVLTLALGIGANTAIFSVVNAVLLRALPYEESEHLVFLSERAPRMDGVSIAWPNYLDWRDRNYVFEQIGVYNRDSYNLTESGEPERLLAGQVTAELFAALRVNAALGRVFTNDEDKPGAAPVVVLSHGVWQRRFGGDPGVVNKTIKLNDQSYTVIGVTPPGFQFPARVELWVSVGRLTGTDAYQGRGNHMGLYGVARLKPDVTVEQARAELTNIAAALEKQFPATNQGQQVSVSTLKDSIVEDAGTALWILLGAVGFVLLIACANVANLLLARASTRRREMAVRLALGAGRWRIVRQLLTESALLALLGGGLGVALAAWGIDVILAISPGGIPRASEIGLDGSVLAFTAAVSLVTGIAFGLLPALQAGSVSLQETLKESGRGLAAGRHWARSVLVVGQIALTLALLVGAGLLLRSFHRLQQVNPGFAYERLLTFRVALPERKYPAFEQRVNFYRQLVENLQSLPGVESAAVSSGLPLGNTGWQSSVTIVGRPVPPPNERILVDNLLAGPSYFRTMGIPLLRGRWFDERDNRDHLRNGSLNEVAGLVAGVKAIIVDEEFARRHFPGEDPVGQRIRLFGDPSDPHTPAPTIVGVVGRVKVDGLRAESNRPQCYVPFYQMPFAGMSVVVKSSTDGGDPTQLPDHLVAAVRRQVTQLDAAQPIYSVRTMGKIRSDSLASERLNLTLLGLFAALALTLAVVGLYGVMSYVVAERTHELGVRLALGAQVRDVYALILRQGMRLALLGVALGLGGALALTRLLKQLLFGVNATDPLTFGGVALLLVGVALLACWIPARRATKVDPMIALRCD